MTHDTGLRRGLNARHIRFMALGSAIGTGLFYGSASAIQMAGPAVLLAYLVAGAAVYMVMRALGEMAVHEPVSGSFGHYASSYLGPLAGFVTGWTYAFEMIIVCLADVTAFGIYMGFWFPDVPLDLGTVHRAVHRRAEPLSCQGLRRAGVLAVAGQGRRHRRDDPRRARHHVLRLQPGRRGDVRHRRAQPVAARRLPAQRLGRAGRLAVGGGIRLRRHRDHRHHRRRGAGPAAGDPAGDQCGAAARPAVLRADPVRADGDLPWQQIGSNGSPSCRSSTAWGSGRPRRSSMSW